MQMDKILVIVIIYLSCISDVLCVSQNKKVELGRVTKSQNQTAIVSPAVNKTEKVLVSSAANKTDRLEVSTAANKTDKLGVSTVVNKTKNLKASAVVNKTGRLRVPPAVNKTGKLRVSPASNKINKLRLFPKVNKTDISSHGVGLKESKERNQTTLLSKKKLIVHGIEASPRKFPYIVSISYKRSRAHKCGGSLIDDHYVLTAAHCCGRPDKYNNFVITPYSMLRIQIGGITVIYDRWAENRLFRYAVEIIPHPYYDPATVRNDICLIRFVRRVMQSEYAKTIPLGTSTPMPNQRCTIAGWGTTSENGPKSTILREAEVKVIDMNQCNGRHSYRGIVPPLTFCAGETIKGITKDACQGDSGGPIVCDDQLSGVVSWGRGCGREQFPGIYTDVSKFRDWIESVLTRKDLRNESNTILSSKLNYKLILIITSILNLLKYYYLC